MVLYSRADSWLGWGEARESDNVLVSLGRIFRISMHGLASTFRSLFTDKDDDDRKPTSLSIARTSVILVLAALLTGGAQRACGSRRSTASQRGRRPLAKDRRSDRMLPWLLDTIRTCFR